MGNTPSCAREALDMVQAGLSYLADADAGQLAAATQAECLRGLERAGSVLTAARASMLAGFTASCEVHHTKHKKNGGPTSATDCVLLCPFHHQIAIHQWGWTLVLNPDGTTTAWNKDKTKVLHSHGPLAGPGNGPGQQANAA